jgi:hypothetical protein
LFLAAQLGGLAQEEPGPPPCLLLLLAAAPKPRRAPVPGREERAQRAVARTMRPNGRPGRHGPGLMPCSPFALLRVLDWVRIFGRLSWSPRRCGLPRAAAARCCDHTGDPLPLCLGAARGSRGAVGGRGRRQHSTCNGTERRPQLHPVLVITAGVPRSDHAEYGVVRLAVSLGAGHERRAWSTDGRFVR